MRNGPNIDVRVGLEDGNAAIHIAAERGYLDICHLLVGYECAIDSVNNNGSTALHLAVANGHTKVASFLVYNGANICTYDNNECTPLDLAIAGGHQLIVDILKPLYAVIKIETKKDAYMTSLKRYSYKDPPFVEYMVAKKFG